LTLVSPRRFGNHHADDRQCGGAEAMAIKILWLVGVRMRANISANSTSLRGTRAKFLGPALRILEETDSDHNAMHSSTESPAGRLRISLAPNPGFLSDRVTFFLRNAARLTLSSTFRTDVFNRRFD